MEDHEKVDETTVKRAELILKLTSTLKDLTREVFKQQDLVFKTNGSGGVLGTNSENQLQVQGSQAQLPVEQVPLTKEEPKVSAISATGQSMNVSSDSAGFDLDRFCYEFFLNRIKAKEAQESSHFRAESESFQNPSGVSHQGQDMNSEQQG